MKKEQNNKESSNSKIDESWFEKIASGDDEAFIGGVLNEPKIEVKDGIVETHAAVLQLGSSSLPERVGVAKALISHIDLAEVLIGGLLVNPGEMTREMGEDNKEEN